MRFRAVIAGAGITGLALGWYLKKALGETVDLTLLEGSGRCGGWISTHSDKGFLFETGPRSCRTRGAGAATLDLVESLGLQDEVIAASQAAARRYLFVNGRLRPLPGGVFSFLTSSLMKGIIPALWRDLRAEKGSGGDETIASFFTRRLGARFTERLIDPLVSGIFAGDIDALSVQSCFPEICRLEREHGSLFLGMLRKKKNEVPSGTLAERMDKVPIFSFRNGMETLISALQFNLRDHIRLTDPAVEVLRDGDGLKVVSESGKSYPADHLFLALPAQAAAALLRGISPEASVLMCGIPSTSVAVVNLGWNTRVLDKDGFGYLIPRKEKEDILGVVWDSSAFPQQNAHPGQTRLTVMLGGTCHPGACARPPEQLLEVALKAVGRHLGITLPPEAVRVTVARDAIPQYLLGHAERVEKIGKVLQSASGSKISLAGSPWRGVAVNECILDARTSASSFVDGR